MMMLLMKNLSLCQDYKCLSGLRRRKQQGSQEREEKGVCSQEREETPSQQDEMLALENQEEHEDDILPDANPRRNPEDRHGQFLIRQLKPEHRSILHEITLACQTILTNDDLEGGQPLQRGDISYFSLWLMMTALADASFSTFMDQYAPLMGYEISWESIMSSNWISQRFSRTMNTSLQTISLMLRSQIW